MSSRVFITQPVAGRAIERLREVADVTWNADPLHILSGEELCQAARRSDYLFCLLHDHVDAHVIAANPELRIIATMTITPADVDIATATAQRIPVTVIPPIVTEATADLAMALMLTVARRVAEADRLVKSGIVPGSQSGYLEGRGVSGRTLGLLGCGRVGQAVARRARGFGMRLLYHDSRWLSAPEEQALGVEPVSLARLLAESDFVSVHLPLTPETRHFVDATRLSQMKPSAYLINTARGPIVEERALVEALTAGRIAGVGLDVFEHEPHVPPELRRMANVVLTPHIGSAVIELREQMALMVVDNILAVMGGRRPPNCWNPEIYASAG